MVATAKERARARAKDRPLSREDKERLLVLLQAQEERKLTNNLARYTPYAKQRDFHDAGLRHRERLLRAGNQQGKTYGGGAEFACHLSGLYPAWWNGRRFTKPILGWAGSDTGETTRDNPQRVLLGPLDAYGTGLLPRRLIGAYKAAKGTADLLDYCKVFHVSGGWSTLRLKPYSQGRRKWQGPPVDVVWYDEEPEQDIYEEGLARIIATDGICYLTFTPLLGMSDVVMSFLQEESDERHDTNMTIEDALHIPASERQKIIDGFPAHQRDARIKGIPVLGSGQIFPVDEESIKFKLNDLVVPDYWTELAAIDFGWTHPTAAIKSYWDRDNDCVYVTHAYREPEKTPVLHTATLKYWGKTQFAWPHDGDNETAGGKALAVQYREAGLDFLPERAKFADGSDSVEAGLMEMLDRMQTGRLKVADHLIAWFEEMRLYHRKNGRIHKVMDDLMDATRYNMMCLRHGRPVRKTNREASRHRSGWAM